MAICYYLRHNSQLTWEMWHLVATEQRLEEGTEHGKKKPTKFLMFVYDYY